jgi:myosin heavy subunit
METDASPAAAAADTLDPIESAMNGLDSQEPSTDAPTSDLLMDFANELTADEAPDPTKGGKPADDKPAEEEVIPEKPKNKDDWNTLRGSRDKYKTAVEEKEKALAERETRLKALEAELTETKAKTARLAELEEKAQLADEYEKELAVTRVEATRDYKKTISEPLKEIGTLVETLAQENGADLEEVFRMINEPDPAKQRAMFKDLAAGWDEEDRLELRDKTREARTLLDRQAEIRENAYAAQKETERLSAERTSQQKEAARKEFTSAADIALKSLREKVPFIPLVDGETENDRFTALKEKLAGVDFDTQTPRGKAFAAATALLYPQMVKMMQKQAEEIASYKANITKRQSGVPNVAPNTGASAADDGDFLKNFGISEPAEFFRSSGSLDVRG